jgi:fumarate reductase subunit D
MDGLFSLGAFWVFIFCVLLFVLTIVLPFSVYAAQKWAWRTYKETKKINEKLNKILSIAQKMSE